MINCTYDSGEAKPKISFPFFVGSPHTPSRKSKIKEGKFLVFAPATEGSGRGARLVRLLFKKLERTASSPPNPCLGSGSPNTNSPKLYFAVLPKNNLGKTARSAFPPLQNCEVLCCAYYLNLLEPILAKLQPMRTLRVPHNSKLITTLG